MRGKLEFTNEEEWKAWDKAHEMQMPDDGEFKFKFRYVYQHLSDEEVKQVQAGTYNRDDDPTEGGIIDACIKRMEETQAFDDYDGIHMEIEYEPDFDDAEVSIVVRGLLS